MGYCVDVELMREDSVMSLFHQRLSLMTDAKLVFSVSSVLIACIFCVLLTVPSHMIDTYD